MSVAVGVLGWGAIGSRVAGALAAGAVPGAELAGVLTRRGSSALPLPVATDLADLIARCDLVVEAAGVDSVLGSGAAVLDAGRDLLVLSTGALVLPQASRLRAAGPGRVLVCPGALGGLDLLRAASRHAPLEAVELTTTKVPASLVQPWMDADAVTRLTAMVAQDGPREVFRGGVQRAAELFPRNLNVAATLAVVLGRAADLTVVLVADASRGTTSHVVQAHGPAGSYRVEATHEPLQDQPRTSALLPAAVLTSISDYVTGAGAWF